MKLIPSFPSMRPLAEGASALADLTGRVALVTGGARGIGRAIAEVLADIGADVDGGILMD